MPKSKKKEESSDSDSGPDDKNVPPPSKKTKVPEVAPKKDTKGDGGETCWTLEKLRRVNINEFRGRKMVDIREFYEKGGDILPGKKGISLTATQWRRLLEVADEVTAALEDQ